MKNSKKKNFKKQKIVLFFKNSEKIEIQKITIFNKSKKKVFAVVSSLVLIGYLDEKVRDMVYCTENVHDTFMCTFNVLTIGDDDCMMTRQIAADLLR